MNFASSSGDIGVAFEPPLARRSCISDVASARWMAAASLSTIALGVPAGNATPCPDLAEKPGTVSATVRHSGAGNHRSAEVTASGPTFPDFATAEPAGLL